MKLEWLTARPALPVAVALLSGVLVAEATGSTLWPALLFALGSAVLVAVGLATKLPRAPLLWLLVVCAFLTGLARMSVHAPKPLDLRDGVYRGVVDELGPRHIVVSTKLGRIRATFPRTAPPVDVGDHVEAVLSSVRVPEAPTNPGQADFRRSFRARGIVALATLEHATIVGRSTTFASVMHRMRHGLRQLLHERLPEDAAAFMSALVLGMDETVSREVRDNLQRTGTVHLLVISGGHFVLVCWVVWRLVLRLVWRQRLRIVVTVAWVTLYGCLSGLEPPVVRAMVMLGCYFAADWLWKRRDGLTALSLAAVVMMLLNPLDLWSASFQLTFAAAVGLILVAPTVQRLWDEPKHRVLAAATVSASAWLATLPIVAAHFHMMTPITVLANLILTPLMVASVFAGFLLLLVPVGFVGAALYEAVRQVAGGLAMIPYSYLYVPIPGLLLIAAYYAALGGWMAWRGRALKLAAAAAFVVWFIAPAWLAPARNRVLVLDVGAGSCALVERGGQRLLFDAGSNTVPEVGRRIIRPALLSQSILRIDTLVLSHSDRDHTGGAREVIDTFRPSTLLVSEYFADKELLEYAASRGVTVQAVRVMKQPLRWDGFEIFGPPTWEHYDEKPAQNDCSLVMRVSIGGRTVLFPGDIEEKGIDALLGTPWDMTSDVLIAPHHGRFARNHDEFASRIRPKLSVISARAGEYSTEVAEGLRRRGPVFVTGLGGAVDLELSAPELRKK